MAQVLDKISQNDESGHEKDGGESNVSPEFRGTAIQQDWPPLTQFSLWAFFSKLTGTPGGFLLLKAKIKMNWVIGGQTLYQGWQLWYLCRVGLFPAFLLLHLLAKLFQRS